VTGWGRAAAIAAVGLAIHAGCHRGSARPAAASGPAEARALVEQGRFDDAIAKIGTSDDPETLVVLGRAWAGRARSQPLPTPAPGARPGEVAVKEDDARALGFLERAAAMRPDLADAHLAIAEILAPYALAGATASGAKAFEAGGAAAAGPGPDTSVDRVLRSFSEALQADPAGTTAAQELIDFATRAGRLQEADAGYQELIRRRREDPELLVRYGDFLAGPRADPEAALSAYGQALIWKPDDQAVRAKVAAIHLDAAEAALREREYTTADARLREARRYADATNGSLVARLQTLEGQLREIRGR
jgi:tetratricopeptide (TPR) repeat protein